MTTEPKHTPGPWRVIDAPFPQSVFVKAGRDCADGPVKIAECFSSASYTAQANAALIASAPSLLADNERLREALRDIVNAANDLEQNEYHVKVARTALASLDK